MVDKLGPTTGPREKYFARFETHFNGLTKDAKEAIRSDANARLGMVGAEDEVTRDFLEATKSFFASYSGAYQRGDYKEFAGLIKVISLHKNIHFVESQVYLWHIIIIILFTQVSHRYGDGIGLDFGRWSHPSRALDGSRYLLAENVSLWGGTLPVGPKAGKRTFGPCLFRHLPIRSLLVCRAIGR